MQTLPNMRQVYFFPMCIQHHDVCTKEEQSLLIAGQQHNTAFIISCTPINLPVDASE